MQARYTELQISGGFNFLPYLEEFKYSDSIESEADTVEVTLSDNERKNLATLIPARGTEFQFAIVKHDTNTQSLNLGNFELDKIRYAGPPTQVKLYFNSLPNKSGARGIANDTSWEDTTLQKIASDIAGRTGLNLIYEVSNDPEIKRAEQSGESDFEFLERLCRKNSLNMKVHNKQLIIFDAEEYEGRGAVMTLTPYLEMVTHFEFNANSADIYSGAEVKFLPNGISDIVGGISSFLGGEIGGLLNSFTGENGGGNLNINERVHSKAEAEKLSKGAVREKNKNEFKANFDLVGNVEVLAGICFNVAGFGNVFDGKYICDRTEHTLGNGYTTRIQAHKVL